jgi:type IV secretory pathway VirB2 component (pilin)
MNYRNHRTTLAAGAFLSLATARVALAQGYTLPTSTATGFLQQLQTWMQGLASFVTSPLGAFIVIAGIVIAAGTWVLAPKNGALGMGMRAVAAGIAVFNITAIVSWFTFGSTGTTS